MAMENIRVLIVDDVAETRENVRKLLQFEADVEVVGAARSGKEGIQLANELTPDVVLMDVEMPHMDGIAATGRLRKLCPSTAVIILSIYDDARTRARAEGAGAVAFIGKSLPSDMLMATIRQVAP